MYCLRCGRCDEDVLTNYRRPGLVDDSFCHCHRRLSSQARSHPPAETLSRAPAQLKYSRLLLYSPRRHGLSSQHPEQRTRSNRALKTKLILLYLEGEVASRPRLPLMLSTMTRAMHRFHRCSGAPLTRKMIFLGTTRDRHLFSSAKGSRHMAVREGRPHI